MGRDARRTARQRALLAAGRHPATGLAVRPGDETCGTCAHHVALARNTKHVHKCDVHRLGMSHSEASDIRVGWPACSAWRGSPPATTDG